MNTRGLTNDEINQILEQVKNKLLSNSMRVNNVQGRTITVINEEVTKRSGGIMISQSENTQTEFLGNYYSLEEFIFALNSFLKSSNQEETSTFRRKGKTEVDQKVVDQALHDYSSLYVKKLEKEKQQRRGPDFYVVSRSNSDSDEIKKTGGLITSKKMSVKEGQYIDEQSARTIAASVVIEVPTKKEVEEAIRKSRRQEPMSSTFERRSVSDEVARKIFNFATKTTIILMIPAIAFSLKIPLDFPINTGSDIPTPTPVEQLVEYVEQSPEIDSTRTLENGDIVYMIDGMHYDHNSQANDGISGEIGANPYREEGDYTVDVIALIDSSTGNIVDYTAEPDGNLENLLETNGYSMKDVDNGSLTVRYNVSEGQNPDLDRTNAAGWVTYDSKTYQDKGNIIQQAKVSQKKDLEQGGKVI